MYFMVTFLPSARALAYLCTGYSRARVHLSLRSYHSIHSSRPTCRLSISLNSLFANSAIQGGGADCF